MNRGVLSGRDLAAALGVIVIWGLNFVAMKVALRDFTPMQLGAARYVFAALPMVLFVRRPAVPWAVVAAYGLAQGLGQFGLLFLALQAGMTAALASVLMQTQVFFTALFAYFALHERLTRPLAGGLSFAGAGVACFLAGFAGAGPTQAAGVTLAGFALNLCAAAMWSLSNIVVRRLQRTHPGYEPLQLVVWASLAPVLPFIVLSAAIDPPSSHMAWVHASLTAWLGTAYLGWFATLLAYVLWTGLLTRHPTARVAPFSLGVPVVGLVAGMGLLGEHVTAWQAAGVGCTAVALAAVLLGGRSGRSAEAVSASAQRTRKQEMAKPPSLTVSKTKPGVLSHK